MKLLGRRVNYKSPDKMSGGFLGMGMLFDIVILGIVLYLIYLVLTSIKSGASDALQASKNAFDFVTKKVGTFLGYGGTGIDYYPSDKWPDDCPPSTTPDGKTGNDKYTHEVGDFLSDDPYALPDRSNGDTDISRLYAALQSPVDSLTVRTVLSNMTGMDFSDAYDNWKVRAWNTSWGISSPQGTNSFMQPVAHPGLYSLTSLIRAVCDADTVLWLDPWLIAYVTNGEFKI